MSMTNAVLVDSLKYYLTSQSPVTRPTTWQVHLHTADPGTGTANEVTDSGYAAQTVTFDFDGTGLNVVNQADLNFGTASAGYTVTHVSVWDQTNGTPLVTQKLTTSKTVAAAAQAIMAAGELKIGGSL